MLDLRFLRWVALCVAVVLTLAAYGAGYLTGRRLANADCAAAMINRETKATQAVLVRLQNAQARGDTLANWHQEATDGHR